MSNYSRQREEIYNLLKQCRNHPNAYQVYEMVKKSGSKMSRSTVYRNLKLLSEEGRILKIEGKNGSCHYDWAEIEHCHAICRHCGKIFDFDYKKIEEIRKNAEFQLKGNFDEISVTVSGICEECLKQSKKLGS